MNDLQIDCVRPLLGVACIIFITYTVSENKRAISWINLVKGLVFQFLLALVLLKVDLFQDIFVYLNRGVLAVQDATRAGTSTVFGYLGGGGLPFDVTAPEHVFILGLQALPMILVFSALSAVLYYWQILPKVVGAFAWVLGRLFKIGGACSFATIATVFVGMVEAPLLINPYLKNLTRSELLIVMSSGMATLSGTVLVLYASFLKSVVPGAIGHLLVGSIISAPISVMLSLLVVPLLKSPHDLDAKSIKLQLHYNGLMDAISTGTLQGLKLLANVLAMLIVLIALVSLANSLLSLLTFWLPSPVSLQSLVGIVMQPLAWSLGIEWGDTQIVGQLLGTKLVLNEFIAYLDFSKLPLEVMSDKSRVLMTYLLCGFANFGSLGIVIAGLGAMAPTRRDEVISLGGRALLVGTLSSCLSSADAALILFGFN
jgi:CNT family concentrative nucleoside transporter